VYTGEQLGVALPQLDFSVAGPDMLVCIVLFCGLPLAYTLTKSMVKRIDEDQYTAQVSCLRMIVNDKNLTRCRSSFDNAFYGKIGCVSVRLCDCSIV
jgi:hypothetical protein